MNQDRTRKRLEAQEQLEAALTAATAEIASMPEGEERRRYLRYIATWLVGAPEEVKDLAVRQCPDLENTQPFPDTLLPPSEQEIVSRLSPSDLRDIDEALIANSISSWQRISSVVGATLVAVGSQFPGISHGFYVQRIGHLVQTGELQAQGNIEFMRLSEVGLAAASESAA